MDKNIQYLVDTIQAFGDTSNLVHLSLEGLEATYKRHRPSMEDEMQSREDELMWRGVQSRLTQCEGIIKELWGTIAGVRKEHTNLPEQALRQFKLKMKSEKILATQSRLQSHTLALSLSLQAVKMCVSVAHHQTSRISNI